MTDIAVGQWVLLLTTLAGFGVQIYRENRKRAWDIEDRRNIAAQVEASAQALKAKVQGQHQEVIREIQTNTKVSVDAFSEANGVNAKILDLTRQIRDLRMHPSLAAVDQQQIDAIDERTAQHTEQLSDIQRKVDHE